ncbi:GAF and ANTAR domain-containing protein [Streptomyces sp. NPDC059165]|uniref:GAF and ANTAR domain-containing protein n=1 Tax=Streptomyces sp. NPDC059165 TaxID=3346751 RepID=UPI003675E72B
MDTVCSVAVDVCGVDAATAAIGRGERHGSLHASDGACAAVEDLQITIGEGPGIDAWQSRDTVMTADLAESGPSDRWPGFAPMAHGWGVRALFVFPLQVGAVRLGTLSLYRYRPGPLTPEQAADALLLTTFALELLLTVSHRDDARRLAMLGLGEDSLKVYQATGMAAAQLAVGIEEAFSRLRAHAFGSGLSLAQAADRLLTGEFVFVPRGEGGRGGPRADDPDGQA